MAVNRFSRPVNSRLISQFAPRDLNLIAKVLASKQMRYDQEVARLEAAQDEHSKLSGYGQADQEILKNAGENLNKIAQEYSNKDLSDPRIARELRNKAKVIANDPLIRATQQTATAVQEYQKARKEIQDYQPWNDVFGQQLAQYQGAQDGPLMFNGITEGVNERETAEKFFDNLPTTGQKSYAQLGETFRQVGWEGITTSQVEKVAGNSIDSFANTPAGRQAYRRYKYLENMGALPVDKEGNQVSAKAYLGSILMDAGSERIGTKNIGGVVSGGGYGGSAFPSSSSGFPGPQIPTRIASTLAKLDLDFNEDGSVEGSGNSKWIEWITGEKSFSEVLNDESLTPKEQEDVELLQTYANALGITPKQAYEKLDQTMSPIFYPHSSASAKKIFQEVMYKEGSGLLNHMMAYDSHGNPIPGKEVLEEAGLVDSDGQLVDGGASLNILGRHNPETGLIPDGVHVDINGKYYIFELPTDEPARVAAATKANFMATGIAKDPADGHYRILIPGTGGKIGVWDKANNKLVPLDEWKRQQQQSR